MNNPRPTELPPEIAAKSVLGLRGTELERRKRFPRARRWVFNGAVVLSLVLFVGNYWLWVRSASGNTDFLFFLRGTSLPVGFISSSGAFGFQNFPILIQKIDAERVGGSRSVVTALANRTRQSASLQFGEFLFGFYVYSFGADVGSQTFQLIDFETENRSSVKGVPRGEVWFDFPEQPLTNPQIFGTFGIFNEPIPFAKSSFIRGVAMPHWFLQLLSAILPLWWLWRWAERRAEKKLARKEASQ